MDSFDYQRSNLPSRLPPARTSSLPAQRHSAAGGDVVAPSPLSVRAVVRASRRYWWLILALWTVGVSGLGALIFLKVHPQYHAFSLLKVEPNELDLYGSSNQFGGASYMQTYVDLITTPSVFSAALLEPEVAQLPRLRSAGDGIQELTRAIQVRIRPNTTLIEVSTTSSSPDEAAIMVNAVVEKFLRANQTWSGKALKDQITKLKDYHAKLKAQSDVLEGEIESLAREGMKPDRVVVKEDAEAPVGDKPAQVDLNVENYKRMFESLTAARTEFVMAQTELMQAQSAAEEAKRQIAAGGPKPTVDPRIEDRINADPEMAQLSAQYNKAKTSYDDAVARAANGMGDPAAQKAMLRLKSLVRDKVALRERIRRRLESEPQVAGAGSMLGPDEEVRQVRAKVQALATRRDALEGQLRNFKIESNAQMGGEVKARIKDDRRKYVEANANQIQNRLDALEIQQANEERIHRIDEARREKSPISDKRKLYMAVTPFGVLGVVLALAVLLELRSGRVGDPEILSTRLPHEVFAIAPLPTARAALGSTSDRNEQRLARFVQSLDHLRVALCEGGTNGEGRCVMITSATGGEGKTTLSAHLAARCANAGTTTLLIDADLRRGSLGRLLDVPAGLGLGDVLAGQVELDGSLISTQAGGFHFLSAGTPGIDPTRVLRSTRLAELIGQLRQMYDLILIDTPPVLPVADALILGRWADGAVMAARYDASRLPLVERANRQILAAGIPVLGVVVNGVKGQDQAYGNYAYNYASPGDSLDSSVTAS